MFREVPDNYDLLEIHEAEQERLRRMRKRLEYAFGDAEREEREDEG